MKGSFLNYTTRDARRVTSGYFSRHVHHPREIADLIMGEASSDYCSCGCESIGHAPTLVLVIEANALQKASVEAQSQGAITSPIPYKDNPFAKISKSTSPALTSHLARLENLAIQQKRERTQLQTEMDRLQDQVGQLQVQFAALQATNGNQSSTMSAQARTTEPDTEQGQDNDEDELEYLNDGLDKVQSIEQVLAEFERDRADNAEQSLEDVRKQARNTEVALQTALQSERNKNLRILQDVRPLTKERDQYKKHLDLAMKTLSYYFESDPTVLVRAYSEKQSHNDNLDTDVAASDTDSNATGNETSSELSDDDTTEYSGNFEEEFDDDVLDTDAESSETDSNAIGDELWSEADSDFDGTQDGDDYEDDLGMEDDHELKRIEGGTKSYTGLSLKRKRDEVECGQGQEENSLLGDTGPHQPTKRVKRSNEVMRAFEESLAQGMCK